MEAVVVVKAMVVMEAAVVMKTTTEPAAMVKAPAVESAVNRAPVRDPGGSGCA